MGGILYLIFFENWSRLLTRLKAPKVTAIHAGLECGVLGAIYPDMEMISFGATIKNGSMLKRVGNRI
jgi:hypothetical protein